MKLELAAGALAIIVLIAALCFRQVEAALHTILRWPAERRRRKKKAVEAQQDEARRQARMRSGQ